MKSTQKRAYDFEDKKMVYGVLYETSAEIAIQHKESFPKITVYPRERFSEVMNELHVKDDLFENVFEYDLLKFMDETEGYADPEEYYGFIYYDYVRATYSIRAFGLAYSTVNSSIPGEKFERMSNIFYHQDILKKVDKEFYDFLIPDKYKLSSVHQIIKHDA